VLIGPRPTIWPTATLGPAQLRARDGSLGQAATWAGGAHSAQRRNPPGLNLVQTNLGRWITSDGRPSFSGEQNPSSCRSVETLVHFYRRHLSLPLLLSHRQRRELGGGAPCGGRRGGRRRPEGPGRCARSPMVERAAV
jgi:hypothetical protein